MKKFFGSRNIWIVFSIIAAFLLLDFGFGLVIETAQSHAKGGDTKNRYYIQNECNDSVLIMGSSRANHHYIPDSIAKRFGVPVYNCGIDGNGIVLAYSFLNNIIENGGRPRMIVYDFFPSFDLYGNADRARALNFLRPVYNRSGIREIIDDIDPNEYVKLNLASYRFNSIFIQILSDAVAPQQSVAKGYKPLQGTIKSEFKPVEKPATEIDSINVKYFKKFVALADEYNIELVFVTSPSFHEYKSADGYAKELRGLMGDREYLYSTFQNDTAFTGHNELFDDPAHLNHVGAEKFTAALLDSINKMNVKFLKNR